MTELANLALLIEAQCIPYDQQVRVQEGLDRGASIEDARTAVALIRADVGNYLGEA